MHTRQLQESALSPVQKIRQGTQAAVCMIHPQQHHSKSSPCWKLRSESELGVKMCSLFTPIVPKLIPSLPRSLNRKWHPQPPTTTYSGDLTPELGFLTIGVGFTGLFQQMGRERKPTQNRKLLRQGKTDRGDEGTGCSGHYSLLSSIGKQRWTSESSDRCLAPPRTYLLSAQNMC